MKFIASSGKRVRSKASLAVFIDNFLATKSSSHSMDGLVLQHLLEYCQANGLGFQLTYVPNVGYGLKRIKKFDLRRIDAARISHAAMKRWIEDTEAQRKADQKVGL